ncbi:cytochrome ubiquinol oxidase subunit I, partial [Pseudomonas sp. HMWF007]
YRLMHMATAAFVSTAFFVGSSAAWHLLRGKDNPAIRTMLSMAMWMALIVAPIQAVIGDFHGLNTLEHQPAKIAAIEGHWENKGDEATPLILFGWPDMKEEKTKFAVEIPYLGSLILTHSLDKQVPALKEFPPEDRPNSTIVFWSFRIMVGLGFLMIFTGLWSLWLRKRDTLYTSRPFLYLALWMGPSGLIAILAGWFTTEIGRQPWVVYGLMRTADASSNHSFMQMSITLIMFVLVYFALFGAGLGYMMRLVRKGPKTDEGKETNDGGPGQKRTPARPLSAADDEGTDADQARSLEKEI